MGETNKKVAQTILKQLGGNKFIAMTGSKNFACDNTKLTFRFPQNGPRGEKSNYCIIKLNGLDLYDVTFKRIRGVKITDVSEHNNIYDDMLQGLFTMCTGLNTTL
jgi:hypothetical protein